MRLGGLLGSLTGLSRGGASEPSAKRQKRTDVLESLGLDGKASRASSLSASGRAATPSRPLGGLAASSASKSAASAVGGLAGSDSDKEALRQWLAGEEPKASKESDASAEAKTEEKASDLSAAVAPEPEPSSSAAAGAPGPAPARCPVKLDANWREAFAKATDRWDVEQESLRCFYFHSEQGLFFEWDQRAGLLFQYFFDSGRGSDVRTVPAAADELPERGPIWSAESPETHAEVWEVLPLPPTDPAAKASEPQVPFEEAAAEEPAAASAASSSGNSGSSGSSASSCSSRSSGTLASCEGQQADQSSVPDSLLMAPPPPPAIKKKKRPPVPAMAPPPSAQKDDDDDDDDDGLRLPGESDGDMPVLGCAGPPPAPASSSSSSVEASSSKVEEEEEDDGSRPLIFDDDEEVGDLAAEDCALPEAPSEKAEPSATDLELDMFAGL